MITDNRQEDQLSITSNEVFKSNIKICKKDNCNEPCIPRGKFCEKHKTKPKKKCEHGKVKTRCKECGGGSLCEHDKIKSQCKECKGSAFCEHDRLRTTCKECGGGSICEHDRIRSKCKECGGGSICIHNKEKVVCKECGGSRICEHGRQKDICKECGGNGICEHDKEKRYCKECGGNGICEHGKRKTFCRECGGGSFCEHDKLRTRCKECGGGSICDHGKRRSKCKECDFIGYLSDIVRCHVYRSLKNDKELHSKEYLGCEIITLKEHIEKQFEEGMTWDNYGKWHIDHTIPIKYDGTSIDEAKKRLHYTNTKPMWAKENMSKGNRYIG